MSGETGSYGVKVISDEVRVRAAGVAVLELGERYAAHAVVPLCWWPERSYGR
jgi:hypothetical protein